MQQDKSKVPVYIIGAGGIVNHAHLPAYAIAGFDVAGIYDVDTQKAITTARHFKISQVFYDLSQMLDAAKGNLIFDIAVPGDQLVDLLAQLPDHAKLLMQKPMGNDFEMAKKILDITREKNMIAAVNFQLRYAPFILAAKKVIKDGSIGELCDIEINVNIATPWHLWNFLNDAPRVEILYHSIHYIDLVRHLLGNPVGIYAKTVKHPLMKQLASVRSNIILDYGELVRANILTNHCHAFGLHNQQSYIKLEGTKGGIKIQMGVLMDYPKGNRDLFEFVVLKEGEEPKWEQVEMEGSWFPHAFIGSMQQMIDIANGTSLVPDNSVEDCIHTMACVEAAYRSSGSGSVLLKDIY